MIQKLEFLLVGDRGDKSLSDYRRAILTAYTIVIATATAIYYIIANILNRQNPSFHLYYIFIGVLIISFSFNRTGRHWVAKIILLSILNFVVFAFSSREPAVPAALLFYILSGLMPLVVFDAKEKRSMVLFVLFSLLLYFIARFTTFSLVPYTPIDPAYLERAYNNNLIIVFACSILAVYYLVRINNSVEESLQHREKQILEKNQILTKTNEELDRFIYSTSHDLRAPLNSIEGLINLSERSSDPVELAEYHSMMRDRVLKLEQVLKDISLYSKNAKLDVEKRPVRLADFVRQAVYDVQFMKNAQNVRIDIEIPDHAVIQTDIMRLSIILNNLIANAIKYSDANKPDPYVIVRFEVAGSKSAIIIEDNGEGIAPEHLPKIFTMFYRASIKSQGSGLGLYLVKETVDKLGGTIDVTSERGRGTTFVVTI
jgi:signal transduction histidine kinase